MVLLILLVLCLLFMLLFFLLLLLFFFPFSVGSPFFQKMWKWCISHVLAQAAITKYHRLGGLNIRHLFFTDLEAGKSKIKVPAHLVSGVSLLSGSQVAVFLLYPYVAESRRPLQALIAFLTRALIHHEGSTLMIYLPSKGPTS